eukprot:754711-Hanusia_phi.AAC.1
MPHDPGGGQFDSPRSPSLRAEAAAGPRAGPGRPPAGAATRDAAPSLRAGQRVWQLSCRDPALPGPHRASDRGSEPGEPRPGPPRLRAARESRRAGAAAEATV